MIHSSFLHAYMLSHLQLGFYLLFFSQKFGVIFFYFSPISHSLIDTGLPPPSLLLYFPPFINTMQNSQLLAGKLTTLALTLS